MKRIIYFIAIFLLASSVQAQAIDKEGLQKFINELKALKGEHVEFVNESDSLSHIEFPSDIVSVNMGESRVSLLSVKTSGPSSRFACTISADETGYNLVCAVLYKYYDVEREDIFGIPLMACKREDGQEDILFFDENNTLFIRDDGEGSEISIIYGNFNLMEQIQKTLQTILKDNVSEYVDVAMSSGMDFSVCVNQDAFSTNSSYCPSADSESIMAFARKIYADNIALLNERLATAATEEQREELTEEIAEVEKEQDEALEQLSNKLEELGRPSFVEPLRGSDEHYVAIPKVPDALKEKIKPYAASGVYDWINCTGFGKGYKNGHLDQISCIVTPRDIAREYVIRNYPRNKWYDEGFTPEYKELAATEYQGGTPAVLYRFSQNEKGYNEMLQDIGHFFNLKLGERFLGLEVTQFIERNGKRFVQLWGEGGTLVCILDSPADKFCHMSIIVGGVSGFEQAVNEYIFGGEKDFAKRCNIIINSDLGNNSYGIHFTTDEYPFAGKVHKTGVHIDFGYIKQINNK